MNKIGILQASLFLLVITGCFTTTDSEDRPREFNCDGKTIPIYYDSQVIDGIPKDDILAATRVFLENTSLKPNEKVFNVTVKGDHEVRIRTLIETEAEKKRRLEAKSKGRIWLASKGRSFYMKRKYVAWAIDRKGS